MKCMVNGDAKHFEGSISLQELLRVLGYREEQKLAVAVNTEFVPKSTHGERLVADGDDIEIVGPMQGG
ncbi:MAG: sulfur carrier protein [Candidatus Omnitrophota bacterium]|jgi:sulfur carrier protein